MRVAAYQRVSEPDIEQVTSLELLKRSYEERINRCRRYKCVGCYFDEGDSRAGFEKLMAAAESGEIDRIETRSAFEFFEGVKELIDIPQKLKSLDTPVQIHFEQEDVTTGTIMWDHCIQFLAGYLQSECDNYSKRLAERRGRGLCRI